MTTTYKQTNNIQHTTNNIQQTASVFAADKIHSVYSFRSVWNARVPVTCDAGATLPPPLPSPSPVSLPPFRSLSPLRRRATAPAVCSCADVHSTILTAGIGKISPGARFSVINCWKSIGDAPVAQWPMAVCDASTVNPARDLVARISPENGNMIYNVLPSSSHRWYTYPAMTSSEVLMFKQYDTMAGTVPVPHSAFDAYVLLACSRPFYLLSLPPPSPPLSSSCLVLLRSIIYKLVHIWLRERGEGWS